jgi:hypothetical protein
MSKGLTGGEYKMVSCWWLNARKKILVMIIIRGERISLFVSGVGNRLGRAGLSPKIPLIPNPQLQ